jgi:hypothetical protein
LVAGIGRANVFVVPDGYFDAVPDTILASVTNNRAAGGDVPQDYFDNLSHNILSKIEGTVANELQAISPFIAGLKKVTPYEVPENYFEDAAGTISSQVAAEQVPPVLQHINKTQPFEVPAGYFEQLAEVVLTKAKGQTGAKVIAMPKRSNAIWKYAAAAVFTGSIFFGVYKYAGTTASGNIPIAMDETKFNQTLDNLGEDDIIKYLENHGTQEDVAALTSGIDEADLPDQEEYFADDATLDKFLENIELKN